MVIALAKEYGSFSTLKLAVLGGATYVCPPLPTIIVGFPIASASSKVKPNPSNGLGFINTWHLLISSIFSDSLTSFLYSTLSWYFLEYDKSSLTIPPSGPAKINLFLIPEILYALSNVSRFFSLLILPI